LQWIPSIGVRQLRAEVRRQRHDHPFRALVECASALYVARGSGIECNCVHQDARRKLSQAYGVREMNPVVRAKSETCDDEVERCLVEARARVLEVLGNFYIRVARRRRGQREPPTSVWFYEKKTRAIQVRRIMS
jgi:adenylyl- and sulfurtransferase ThiI